MDSGYRNPALNILHLVHGRSFTGQAAAALTDVRALAAAGHAGWIGAKSGTALERDCQAQDVPFAGGFKQGRGLARILHLRHDIKRLRALAAELNLDVVHVHRTSDEFLANMAFGKRRPRPALVRTWHRDPRRVPAPILKRLVRSNHAFCCVAREHVEVLRAAGARHVDYLPPGVDTEFFRLHAVQRDNGPPRIGMVGRMKIHQDRGHHAFLDILCRLGGALRWRARIIGHGEGVEPLMDWVKAHPQNKRILVTYKPDDFAESVASLDVGLVFAIGSDGTSRPALEMLACGVPILVADLPGLRELAEDRACGRVLPLDGLDAWTEELQRLLSDPDSLRAMQAAARARAEKLYALPVRGQRLAEFYGKTK